MDLEGKVVAAGHIDFKKFPKDLIVKGRHAVEILKSVIEEFGVTQIAAEAALLKFSVGKSSAHTITTLAAFNFGITFLLNYLTNVPVKNITFADARRNAGFKFAKGLKSADKKQIITSYCSKKYPMLNWPKTKTNKFKPWCLDVADSLIINETAIKNARNTKGNN